MNFVIHNGNKANAARMRDEKEKINLYLALRRFVFNFGCAPLVLSRAGA